MPIKVIIRRFIASGSSGVQKLTTIGNTLLGCNSIDIYPELQDFCHGSCYVKFDSFTDDIFFVHVLNAFTNNLQFTCEFSKDKIHLLNMWVVLNNGALSTATF